MRKGYFAGTAILSKQELNRIFRLLQSQSIHFNSPIDVELYETFQRRMKDSKLFKGDEPYPVRHIGTKSIVDTNYLHENCLARRLEELEVAIEEGQLLQLDRIRGAGTFSGDTVGLLKAYPIQIVFHNIAWYLGLEETGENQDSYLRFERLDRLILSQKGQPRGRKEQEKSLAKLKKLYDASAGLFLGDSYREQSQYLDNHTSMELKIELWVKDEKFSFISEGTQRFNKIKMSPPPQTNYLFSQFPSLFALSKTQDKNFPNRVEITLPKWSLKDVDLIRWIIGFGGDIKVITPDDLIKIIKGTGDGISQLYKRK